MSSELTAEEIQPSEASPQDAAVAPPSTADDLSQKLDKMKISSSFSIWPPTQRTRDAVTNRLVETLSTPSVLSKRYGTVSAADAAVIAKSIEDEAFVFAAAAAAAAATPEDPVDGGIEILQVYSKEISKRVLDAVKSRSPASDATGGGGGDVAVTADVGSNEGDAAPASEEVSSADNESSSA